MSGDVQPRKRKDKKRRKDEGEHIPIQTHAPPPSSSVTDDVNIHVHKEGGTGGGICAKLVFFVLLSALVVVIGMIITQYRGLTDVETVDSESRFSHIFEGWTDSSPDHRDDHNIEEIYDDDEHDLDDHDEDDEEHDASEDEDADEQEASEEEEDDDEEEIEGTDIYEERNEDDEDQDEEDDEDEQPLEDFEENEIDDDEEDEIIPGSEEDKDTYESEEKDEDENDDDEDHDEDEQELENIESDEIKDDDDDEPVSVEKTMKEDSDEQKDDADDDKDDDNEAVDKKAPVSEKIEDDGTHEEDTPQESSGMAVKLGVGVALLVVAHLVLVRKWRTAPDDKSKLPKEDSNEPVPDLKRRNTIVMPPTLQEVEPDIEPEEEDYSDEEEEVSEEEDSHEPKSAKTRYQELRSTYSRSLTPEGEIDYHKPPDPYEGEYVDEEEEEEVSEEEDEEGRRDGESEEEDEYDEDEDEELLKRLEAKYGKLRGEGVAERQADNENSDSEKSEDDAGYEYSNITNKDDYKIKSEIDEAQKTVQNNSAYAIKLFDKILQKHPSSPRSIYGKALALDYLADQRRSNQILEQALKFYTLLLNTQDVPNALFEMGASRCINRMRFVGQYKNAINVHKLLIQRFPNNPKYPNDLAVTYLTINRNEEARTLLKQILAKWPDEGLALVHYGFILKTADNELENAVKYLRRGLDTRSEGVIDGRFYFHLGDALARLGRNDKAMKVYEEGVENGVFLSKYQRSLYNVPRLTGKPWWHQSDLPYQDLFRLLKENWEKIRDEGLSVLNEKGYFQDESENLKDTGDWKQFELYARGQKNLANCKLCPFTCNVIDRIPEAKGCKRGQTKFSVMHPGTHVWPHCGPTNCRLRAHLGLKVPSKTFIRVEEETRSWEEGEIFVFDDSFEHEVWHNGTEFRLVLIVDIWHPELTAAEKRSLSPI